MIVSKEKLHVLFEAGTFLKAATSLCEILLGILFFIINSSTVNQIIIFITGDELTEQPRDSIWDFFFHGFNGVSSGNQHFWGFIFIAHGLVVMILVIGLMRRKLSVYSFAALLFTCLLAYQIFHITYTHSVPLSILSVFDAVFIWLIIREYRYQRQTG